ncbi:hypothetical protein [Streptosporangium sp. NPDC000396]|uniref:hypothetical protein n=1 Tax=Streptosporangium sp. NPDC000396 TaxID=3366185 RepID=UPI0036C5552D
MTQPVMSSAVMAHPRRAVDARRLAAELGRGTAVVFDPDPGGRPSPLRTAARAWASCPPGSTHHLVVQDDAEPARDFWPLVERAVHSHPERVLTLYANSASWNGSVARVAMFAGHTWVTPMTDEYFPSLAVVMPCATAHGFAEAATAAARAGEADDDEVMVRFLATQALPPLLRTPNLVEHRELASLSGWDFQGVRKAVCFQSRHLAAAVESCAPDIPAWPRFDHRRSLLRMPSRRGRARWQTQTRSGHLAAVGLPWGAVRAAAAQVMDRLRPLPERRAAAHRLVREVYLSAFTLGFTAAVVNPDAEPLRNRTSLSDAALLSYVEGGLCRPQAVERWASRFDLLVDTAWTALRDGARHGSRRKERACAPTPS